MEDLRGEVHMHTVETDGKCTIDEMAAAAKERGYKYIAITDHSKNLAFANGLDDKRAVQHIARIRAANEQTDGITIMAGIEVDILADGELDLSDSVLEQMDVVVASVHSAFNQEPQQMTDRLLRALSNKNVSILGHPTGRLLLRRDAYPFDMDAILKAALKNKVAMELNAYPDRLDLNDVHLRMARERGVKIVINTDAHHTSHFEKIKYGILQARRAWLTPKDVLNTLPEKEFRQAMKHQWPSELMEEAMAENEVPPKAPQPQYDAGHVPITEEFDSAKRSLPPAVPVVIALAIVGIVVGVIAFLERSKPVAQGGIDAVYASQPADMANTMVALQVTLRNVGDKALYIKSITANLKTDQGDQSDDAASPSDYDRYFSAYPDLREHATQPLTVETKIMPGAEQKGTVLVAFPVTELQFNDRKDLNVTIVPYDQSPIVLREKSAAAK